MHEPGKNRDSPRLQTSLDPIQNLGEIGVAGQGQPDRLEDGVSAGAKLEALRTMRAGHPGVLEQGLAQPGVLGANLLPQVSPDFRVVGTVHANGTLSRIVASA